MSGIMSALVVRLGGWEAARDLVEFVDEVGNVGDNVRFSCSARRLGEEAAAGRRR